MESNLAVTLGKFQQFLSFLSHGAPCMCRDDLFAVVSFEQPNSKSALTMPNCN